MSITTRTNAAGEERLWIALSFRNRKTNAREWFRRDAQVQTKQGAVREERSVIAYWEEHGTILPLLKAPEKETEKEKETEPKEVKTWTQAVTRFKEVALPTLKPSTGRGYKNSLKGPHFEAWQELPLASLTSGVIAEWDSAIASTGVKDSTRATLHVVLRSVLRCALAAGWLPELPPLPPLPKSGRTVVQAVSPADVHALLYETDEGVSDGRTAKRVAARRAFALAAFAGLRASEVRGLRWRDVDTRRGVLTVRHAICGGIEDTPKSGSEREIPITGALAAFLGKAPDDVDTFVCTKADGTSWGDTGLYTALKRASERLGMDRQRVHALRHAFVTGLFDAGVGAHTVMELAGHADLGTTQRYAHTSRALKVEAVAALDRALTSQGNVVRLQTKPKAGGNAKGTKTAKTG